MNDRRGEGQAQLTPRGMRESVSGHAGELAARQRQE